MCEPSKLEILKALLAACQFGRLSQDEEMPECVTFEHPRGTMNILTTNAEGYFAFMDPAYAALLVFVANELPNHLDSLKQQLIALENCRDILEKVNQGHHLGFAANQKINAAIAATKR